MHIHKTYLPVFVGEGEDTVVWFEHLDRGEDIGIFAQEIFGGVQCGQRHCTAFERNVDIRVQKCIFKRPKRTGPERAVEVAEHGICSREFGQGFGFESFVVECFIRRGVDIGRGGLRKLVFIVVFVIIILRFFRVYIGICRDIHRCVCRDRYGGVL
ncbi:MAG: hypothetical protein ATN35_07435 [Epulopiscium sp. Nele67-Bin004]|nr:MAG: hypothetical protein ATN35_07435 [Epulopiscium sp. Nele67-Bin004]